MRLALYLLGARFVLNLTNIDMVRNPHSAVLDAIDLT